MLISQFQTRINMQINIKELLDSHFDNSAIAFFFQQLTSDIKLTKFLT